MNQLTPQEAALYYGQQCIVYSRKEYHNTREVDEVVLKALANELSLFDYKLLLRPLADITEEEADEVFAVMGWNTDYFAKRESILAGLQAGVYEAAKYIQLLLSKGFDLFNWIEQDKALDKTAPSIEPASFSEERGKDRGESEQGAQLNPPCGTR